MATALCALIGAALLVGCAPQTSSTPTPTPHFTSEQQAYAAAEQTYRNYIDALNKVDLSDPATFEDVYKWETGDALDTEKKSLTQMHADGWVLSGRSDITLMRPAAGSEWQSTQIQMDSCVDVGKVSLRDAHGDSTVAADRGDVQSIVITFVASSVTATGWRVSNVDGRDEGPKCG